MLRKNKQQIIKNQINNSILLKYEIKNIILKSLIHNNNINNSYKLLANILLKKKIKKNKKVCLISGHHHGVDNKLNLSRHNLNYFSKLGLLQNFKIKSW